MFTSTIDNKPRYHTVVKIKAIAKKDWSKIIQKLCRHELRGFEPRAMVKIWINFLFLEH
ncbi:MAG: hypothetical protein AAFQ80_19400 [Cyanobacteria bacterium J06621_8]